jgi:hypothetical protein
LYWRWKPTVTRFTLISLWTLVPPPGRRIWLRPSSRMNSAGSNPALLIAAIAAASSPPCNGVKAARDEDRNEAMHRF